MLHIIQYKHCTNTVAINDSIVLLSIFRSTAGSLTQRTHHFLGGESDRETPLTSGIGGLWATTPMCNSGPSAAHSTGSSNRHRSDVTRKACETELTVIRRNIKYRSFLLHYMGTYLPRPGCSTHVNLSSMPGL